jgi:hypothetical protein
MQAAAQVSMALQKSDGSFLGLGMGRDVDFGVGLDFLSPLFATPGLYFVYL